MQLIGELGHSPPANEPGSLESLFRIRDVRAQKFRWLCVQQTDLMRFPKNIFLVYFSTPASVSIGNGDNFLLWQDYSINELSMPNMVLVRGKYCLRSELLVSEMDVFRTKIYLDTSISATSNSERREYVINAPSISAQYIQLKISSQHRQMQNKVEEGYIVGWHCVQLHD